MPPAPRDTIVITTIHPPGVATSAFARVPGWRLMVVGDRKTPARWKQKSCRFISVADQERLSFSILKALPWHHYARKMVGYLLAMAEGAARIADSDDDNIPSKDWGVPPFDGDFEVASPGMGFVNVYGLFCENRPRPWPRGFPLSRILQEPAKEDHNTELRYMRVGIWQGLVAGEADVDAIYRLTVNRPVLFSKRNPVVLDTGTFCPFNSQNTVFRKELFPLLYLPAFVTFRFTDILRSLVAQPILWAAGYHLGFISPTVTQERNPHDLLSDFESEIPCYLHSEKAADIVGGAVHSSRSVSENLIHAYESLCKKDIVPSAELTLVNAWVADIERISAE